MAGDSKQLMDPASPEFKARVLMKLNLLTTVIPKLFSPGRTTAMALRMMAKLAEVEESEITQEMLLQEYEFLLADLGAHTTK